MEAGRFGKPSPESEFSRPLPSSQRHAPRLPRRLRRRLHLSGPPALQLPGRVPGPRASRWVMFSFVCCEKCSVRCRDARGAPFVASCLLRSAPQMLKGSMPTIDFHGPKRETPAHRDVDRKRPTRPWWMTTSTTPRSRMSRWMWPRRRMGRRMREGRRCWLGGLRRRLFCGRIGLQILKGRSSANTR